MEPRLYTKAATI